MADTGRGAGDRRLQQSDQRNDPQIQAWMPVNGKEAGTENQRSEEKKEWNSGISMTEKRKKQEEP